LDYILRLNRLGYTHGRDRCHNSIYEGFYGNSRKAALVWSVALVSGFLPEQRLANGAHHSTGLPTSKINRGFQACTRCSLPVSMKSRDWAICHPTVYGMFTPC
jgi:hypothetical protein